MDVAKNTVTKTTDYRKSQYQDNELLFWKSNKHGKCLTKEEGGTR